VCVYARVCVRGCVRGCVCAGVCKCVCAGVCAGVYVRVRATIKHEPTCATVLMPATAGRAGSSPSPEPEPAVGSAVVIGALAKPSGHAALQRWPFHSSGVPPPHVADAAMGPPSAATRSRTGGYSGCEAPGTAQHHAASASSSGCTGSMDMAVGQQQQRRSASRRGSSQAAEGATLREVATGLQHSQRRRQQIVCETRVSVNLASDSAEW